MGLDVGFGGAFLAGIISFLSPCVLPLVPPYLSFLAGASLDELTAKAPPPGLTGRMLLRAAAFVLGFATVFVILGASASAIGRLLAEYLPLLSKLAGIIIILFGLHFLGLFRLAFLYREVRVAVPRQPASFAGAYVVGLAFAFGWTPCVGPVLASILFVAGAEETARQGASLLGVYAAGIGLPFFLAAAFVRPFIGFLRRFRAHLGAVEKTMGVLLVIAGTLILTGWMADVAGWLLETFPILGRIG